MGRAVSTCAVPRTKQAAGGKLPCNIGSSARAVWGPRGGDGSGGGRLKREEIYVHIQLIHVLVQYRS